jgi:hypothetical protein
MMPPHGARAGSRWVGLAGLTFCGLFILSFVVAFGAPEAMRSDEKILDWYLDSTNQTRFLVATMIGGLGGIAFLVFLVGLRRKLAEADAPDVLVELVYAAGLILIAMLAVGAAIGSGVVATLVFSDRFELDPDTARIVLTIGNIWMPAFAGVPGALFLAAASLASRRTGFLPGWLVWVGFVLTPLVFLAYPGFGINTYLAAVWVLLVSIVLLRRREAAVT